MHCKSKTFFHCKYWQYVSSHETDVKKFPVECLHFTYRYKWLTRWNIRKKNITFSEHSESENSYKGKSETVNKLLKDTYTKEDMHLICHSDINVKRHLNRSNLRLNNNGISALVRNFKKFLKNFDSVWLQNKDNLFTTGHGSLSSENSESCFSIITRFCVLVNKDI